MDEIFDSMQDTIDSVEERELTPTQYFELVKNKKHTIDDETLKNFYDSCLVLLNKYKKTKQVKAMKKLIFLLENIEKERKIVSMGVNTFVYREDIEEFIGKISKDVVKIIELENYEREIPDEIVEVIEKVGGFFDKLYVVFTDYTGEVERQVEQERRDKDPILFGTFQDNSSRTVIDRFYFLGDWEDEYCDLTLDKMVAAVKSSTNKDIAMEISTPEDIASLKAQLETLQPNGLSFKQTSNPVILEEEETKSSLFSNVKSIFTRKKK